MATNRAMLKEAIADAKAVKETAIANAKAALEEAFTPQLKSMLSMKLQEMNDLEEDNFEETYVYEEDENPETYKKGTMEEVDLEELLAELEENELEEVLRRSAALLQLEIDSKAVSEIASRSRGTPRIANRLLRRVRDYAQVRSGVKGSSHLTHSDAMAALEMYEVDEKGLDRLDRSVLIALIERFNGGPVGLSTLAIAVGEETETVESVAEPFLVRNGFMARTPRGRIATAQGWAHVGRTPPAAAATLFDTPAVDA